MAKVIKGKFDLFTLAIKGQLIGTDIHFDEGTFEVSDWYIDYATNEIHVEFTNGTGESLDLKQKHVVSIDQNYVPVQNKGKFKRAKRKK